MADIKSFSLLLEEVEKSVKEIDSIDRQIKNAKEFIQIEKEKDRNKAFLFTSEKEAQNDIIEYENKRNKAKDNYLTYLRLLGSLPL